ncbi:carbohydrate sulfotransferase 8 [Xenopus tropicalis]|uniref:Carbohydrate sulfotransferase n=1 Tax=Xenopus tropicalis TaxID=8364 RepID=Q0D2D0_XENTR|eukprot:NP_001072529.1 carbohydrate sulfotransferase 8 [Xenopus tropicalis]
MRLTCMFSFILLFGAAGLIVFIHLQDPAEMVRQQRLAPEHWLNGHLKGMKFEFSLHQPEKDCTSNNQYGDTMENAAKQLMKINQVVPSYPPYQYAALLQNTNRRQKKMMFLKRENKKSTERKLLKKKTRFLLKETPILIAMNSSAVDLTRLEINDKNGKWKKLYEMQIERKKLMRDICSKYKSSSRRIITPYHVSRIFVEDKHKLLYCEVPKAGCSNWKRVLMVLNGLASSTKDIHHNTVHYGNYLKRLDSFDRNGIFYRLNTYTKMIFIREPFERLVSAFRDKFEHANNYYHPVFGKAIISKYRRNATKEALWTGSGVQFTEFIQYLLDVHRPVGMDIHWDHVSRLCSPCLIDYDFIGKFESMEEDADFLLHLIGAPKNLTFPRFKDRHSNEERTTNKITQQYFAQLSPTERQRTYDFYYMDYQMFNYTKPFEDLY